MPSFPVEETLAFIDKQSRACVFFHLNGKLWSAKKLSTLELSTILDNPSYKINNQYQFDYSDYKNLD